MERTKHYNEYYFNRRPSAFADKAITFWHRRMFDLARRTIKDLEQRSLLEVGVGFGYFCNVCKDKGLRNYCGLEMNENLAVEMSRQGFNITCAAIPPFPDSITPVDVIWMSHILEHARDYVHAREMLQSAYEKIDTNGYIVVIVPDYVSYGFYFYDIDWSHGYPVTLPRLTQILSDVGFSVVFAKHHVGSVSNDFAATLLHLAFKLIPVRLIDWVFFKLCRKTFCRSFMSIFGWRQIMAIAIK